MPIRLILIAHAETDATRHGLFMANEGLNARGREATGRVVGTLPKADAVLTSPAPAAREIAMVLDPDAVVEPALGDLDAGTWAGRSIVDIGMTEAGAAETWIADPTFAGHGGESIERLIARVGGWLASRHTSDGIAIAVTHAAVLRAAMTAVLDAAPSAFWRIDVPPLMALTLGSDGQRWCVREMRRP